jgi:hypothetical protein
VNEWGISAGAIARARVPRGGQTDADRLAKLASSKPPMEFVMKCNKVLSDRVYADTDERTRRATLQFFNVLKNNDREKT